MNETDTTTTDDDTTDTATDEDLSISTDTVTYSLNKDQVRQISALHYVASKDNARPMMSAVHIEYSADELVLTITDSYGWLSAHTALATIVEA